jgi:hypothetical protein
MNKEQDQYESIDNEVFDLEEVTHKDLKLNPDYFIFQSVGAAIKALSDNEFKTGSIKFRVLIETAENVALGAGRLTDEYQQDLDQYVKELPADTSNETRGVKIANRKLRLLMASIKTLQTKTNKLPL